MTDRAKIAPEIARVRISKVRFHDGRELVILPRIDIDNEDTFVWTLVRMLKRAREGSVRCYLGGFIVEDADGNTRSVEFGDYQDSEDGLQLLGLLEGVKIRVLDDLRGKVLPLFDHSA